MLFVIGIVTMFVGKGGMSGYNDSIGINALFNFPMQLAHHQKANIIFVADGHNNIIRKITGDGTEFFVIGELI